MSQLLQSIRSIIHAHLANLFLKLDPVRSTNLIFSKRRFRCFNPHFAFPILVWLLNILLTIILRDQSTMSFEDKYGIQLFRNALFTHRLFPDKFWSMNDTVMVLYSLQLIAIFSCLMFDGFFDSRVIMWEDGSSASKFQMDKSLWKRIHATHRHLTLVFGYLLPLIGDLNAILYFWSQVWLRRLLTWSSSVFWLITFPASVSYFAYANMIPFDYFFISAQYIQLKQRWHLSRLTRLLTDLGRTSPAKRNIWFTTRNVGKFQHLHAQTIHLCAEIHLYNRFWRRYLSIYFLTYGLIISYTTYSLFFIDGDFIHKIIYLFVFIYYIAALCSVMFECAQVIRCSDKLDRTNRTFFHLFRSQLPPRNQIWFDNLTSNELKLMYGFSLNNDYLITSHTFYQLFFYISTFFMLIFRDFRN